MGTSLNNMDPELLDFWVEIRARRPDLPRPDSISVSDWREIGGLSRVVLLLRGAARR